ncbi:MAG: hypothetical protein JRF36_17120 [Deltaproteobacteria bacterium]|nr:hypothetical protein [Deltaproteobacteria bacterium]MBW2487184.1 hypothetical protein [Deltaproteobacteria bacterium]MBW2518412.1 hypothetical protein [Deltaproteobacteria bacterium]
METNDAVEKLKKFVLEHDLPHADLALFGIKCPYCGKSDRIRELEEPDVLIKKMESEQTAFYLKLWDQLARANGSLGVCKFCQNLLLLQNKANAVPLFE